MKTILLLFLPLFAFGQFQERPPTFKDYNYLFVTGGPYYAVKTTNEIDSVSKKIIQRADTLKTSVNSIIAVVSKDAGKLTIRTIDPTATDPDIFSSVVSMVGVTQDGFNSLIYKTDKPEQTILANPGLGFIVVANRNCNSARVCDSMNYYLGNVNLNTLR